MPAVFISHSSKADPYAAAVRQHVQRALVARGWEVRVDIDGLRGGEEWSGVLYHWLADCDAAVILVGRDALTSKWVAREVDLLLWRRSLGSPLTVVPAILGDLTRAEVEPSPLADLLVLELVTQEQSTAALDHAEHLATRIVDRLPDLSATSGDRSDAMRRWLGAVTAQLREVEEREALRAAARALDITDEFNFPSLHEGRRYFAHQLLAPGLAPSIYPAVCEIAWHAGPRLRRLIELLTPAWVDGSAARRLIPNRDRVRVVAVLNAFRPETAEQYIHRAACCSLTFRAETVVYIAGEGQAVEFVRDCEQAIKKLLDLPAPYGLEEEKPRDGDVAFLVIDPRDATLEQVIEASTSLLERFPWLNMVLLGGETGPDPAELRRLGLADALLRPELAANAEREASRAVQGLRKLPARMARHG